jgi:hypothetical protein
LATGSGRAGKVLPSEEKPGSVDSIGARQVLDFGTYCIYLAGKVKD